METTSNPGLVIDTPEGIELYRLLALKGALKLELLGLKRRGASVRSIVCAELGLLPKTKGAAALAALVRHIEARCNTRRENV